MSSLAVLLATTYTVHYVLFEQGCEAEAKAAVCDYYYVILFPCSHSPGSYRKRGDIGKIGSSASLGPMERPQAFYFLRHAGI